MSLFGCFGAPKPARMGTGVTNSGQTFCRFSFQNQLRTFGHFYINGDSIIGLSLFLWSCFRVILKWMISDDNNIIVTSKHVFPQQKKHT